MSAEIIYNPTPDPDNWIIKKWSETPKGEFIDMGVYGQPYKKVGIVSSEINGVWLDEAAEYDNQIKPKKQHKPKHKVPFWANDWRGKK